LGIAAKEMEVDPQCRQIGNLEKRLVAGKKGK